MRTTLLAFTLSIAVLGWGEPGRAAEHPQRSALEAPPASVASVDALSAQPNPADDPSETPDVIVNRVVQAWLRNDAETLAMSLPDMPHRDTWETKWAEVRKEADEQRRNKVPPTPADEMVNAYLRRLQSDDGVESILDEIHAGLSPRIPGWLMAAHAGLARLEQTQTPGHVDAGLAAKTKRIGLGIQDWLDSIDFSDRERLRRALMPFVEVARSHKLDSLDALSAMELDRLLSIGDELMAATKRSVAAYDVEIQPFLQNLHARLLLRLGNRADISVSMQLFGEQIDVPFPMYLVEGKWLNAVQYSARQGTVPGGGAPSGPDHDGG